MTTSQKHTWGPVAYWTYGDAKNPPLLLVHGFTGSHEGFQYIAPLLEKDFFLVIPDLPGFGESKLAKKPWTVDSLARQMNDFALRLALDTRPIVIGHSMGGLVAASMLAQSSDLYAKKAVLISPVTSRVKLLDRRKVGAALGGLQYGVAKHTRATGQKLVKNKRISRITTKLIMTTPDTALQQTIHGHHLKNLEHISSIHFYHELHKDINRRGALDYTERLTPYDILVIAGDKDNVTPLKGERALAGAIGAVLVVVPGVGHLIHYEKPTEAAAAIAAFLHQ